MAITEVTALITASKTAFDIAKSVMSLKGEVERNESVSKLLETLLSVQAQALDVQAKAQGLEIENHELKKKLMEVEDWKNTEENYELKDLGAGTFVYSYKRADDSDEPMHYLCPKCFSEKKKSILTERDVYKGRAYKCWTCSFDITCYDDTYIEAPKPPASEW